MPPKGSYFLFGPRGTGKSTWIKNHYQDCLYIDLLLPELMRSFSAKPERLKGIVEAQETSVVILDEIQRVPELLSVVHFLIEEQRNIQFVLTGSSSRKLKKAGVDLMAGRAIKRSMHPFIAAELQNEFTLNTALNLGMLPIIWGSKDRDEALKSYVDLYIQEKVVFEGLVRDIGNFSRFLSVIAFSHGSVLNATNISRECEVKRHTVENYLSILEDLLLAYYLPVFSKGANRTLSVHPKFYLFDAGVFRSLRKLGALDSVSEIDGLVLEGLVLQHLKVWCDYSKETYELFYWRTKAGLEVDFIVYGNDTFYAIEVKNHDKVFPKDLRGLMHFREDYPESKQILLYRGSEKIMENGVLCLPVEEFLKGIIPNQQLI